MKHAKVASWMFFGNAIVAVCIGSMYLTWWDDWLAAAGWMILCGYSSALAFIVRGRNGEEGRR